MKKYNENMRKKLSEQYSKIAEKKLILKSINELWKKNLRSKAKSLINIYKNFYLDIIVNELICKI